jgi:alkylation response protein AidB-like acyl-CoA dehydrogenase
VPAENRLGREGAGKALFAHSMTWERACILASAVGSMQRLLETCVRHARERRQFGRPIGKNQLIQAKIVDMKLRLETARSLLYQAAWLRGRGRNIFLEAALAKLHISESWVACAEDAIQVHGASGYLRGGELERELRDALGSRIYSGTNEIQRSLVASLLGL